MGERQQFENWCKQPDVQLDVTSHPEYSRSYKDYTTNWAREAWQARASLIGQPPEGWQWVPKEITLDMMIAFVETWYSKRRAIDDCEMQDAYAAMLAAAPQPTVSIMDETKELK